jgi:hypothetical protein
MAASTEITRETKDSNVHVEDSSGDEVPVDDLVAAVHVEGEIWSGINLKTVLAFLVCPHDLSRWISLTNAPGNLWTAELIRDDFTHPGSSCTND